MFFQPNVLKQRSNRQLQNKTLHIIKRVKTQQSTQNYTSPE